LSLEKGPAEMEKDAIASLWVFAIFTIFIIPIVSELISSRLYAIGRCGVYPVINGILQLIRWLPTAVASYYTLSLINENKIK
jgi:hypothetical protein